MRESKGYEEEQKAISPDSIPVEAWRCFRKMAVEFLIGLFRKS